MAKAKKTVTGALPDGITIVDGVISIEADKFNMFSIERRREPFAHELIPTFGMAKTLRYEFEPRKLFARVGSC